MTCTWVIICISNIFSYLPLVWLLLKPGFTVECVLAAMFSLQLKAEVFLDRPQQHLPDQDYEGRSCPIRKRVGMTPCQWSAILVSYAKLYIFNNGGLSSSAVNNPLCLKIIHFVCTQLFSSKLQGNGRSVTMDTNWLLNAIKAQSTCIFAFENYIKKMCLN